MNIAEFVLARIAEDEQWAREASRHNEEPLIQGGEHWRWECDAHDVVIPTEPLTSEFLECPVEDDHHGSASLRSVETYPYHAISGEGPSIHFGTDEITPIVAGHVARWDPARVLAECEAKRRIVGEHSRIPGDGINFTIAEQDRAEDVLLALALPYADHPDFDPAWGTQ